MHAGKRSALTAAPMLALLAVGGCGGSGRGTSTHVTGPSGTGTRAVPTGGTRSPPVTPTPASTSGTVAGSSAGVTATMHVGTHHPKAGRPWPVRFTVTRGGRDVFASVSYEFLFAGQVVARRSHYIFHGRFSDVVVWPASAVGYQLTLRAVIGAAGATINLDYPVQVTR
jgi:hypothetical protein